MHPFISRLASVKSATIIPGSIFEPTTQQGDDFHLMGDIRKD